jgi:hypothetical protein
MPQSKQRKINMPHTELKPRPPALPATTEETPWRSAEASDKLNTLLVMDLHEHITWPLPSWKAIMSGRVYGR